MHLRPSADESYLSIDIIHYTGGERTEEKYKHKKKTVCTHFELK